MLIQSKIYDGILFKKIHDKVWTRQTDVSSSIQESWKQIVEKYCFPFAKFITSRNEDVAKAKGGIRNY